MSDRLLKLLLGVLTFVFVAVVGMGVFMLKNDVGHWTLNPTSTVSPTPTETPTASTVAVMRVPVPADSSCSDCHAADAVSVPNVPPMGHPLEGWANCSICHGEAKLVKTAPGHRGIHRDACMLCHQQQGPNPSMALPRPHHTYPGKSCTDCHKVGGPGPLPQDMSTRQNCWVCHIDAKNRDLFVDTPTAS